MNKAILTALLIVAIGPATFAQTKKPIKKTASPVKIDTANYFLSKADLTSRINATNNLLYIIKKGTDDLTPNQIKRSVFISDSLQNVDAAWLNKKSTKTQQ